MSCEKTESFVDKMFAVIVIVMIIVIIVSFGIAAVENVTTCRERQVAALKAHAWISHNCQSSRMMEDGDTTIWKCGNSEYRFANIANIYLKGKYQMSFVDESNYR